MPSVPYRFGGFVFDVDTRQLLHDGREIHLSPKAFELLAALIRHRARAVSKRELQETLWPTTFVEETNLASLIAEIRRAIGDSATRPAFLRTVHRFGYQFVGEIHPSEVPPAAPARPDRAGRHRTRKLGQPQYGSHRSRHRALKLFATTPLLRCQDLPRMPATDSTVGLARE